LSEGLCGDPFVVAKPFFLEAIGLIKFEERTFELVEGTPELAEIVASLLEARWKLLKQAGERLHDILGRCADWTSEHIISREEVSCAGSWPSKNVCRASLDGCPTFGLTTLNKNGYPQKPLKIALCTLSKAERDQ
jgi:hypothetical protein